MTSDENTYTVRMGVLKNKIEKMEVLAKYKLIGPALRDLIGCKEEDCGIINIYTIKIPQGDKRLTKEINEYLSKNKKESINIIIGMNKQSRLLRDAYNNYILMSGYIENLIKDQRKDEAKEVITDKIMKKIEDIIEDEII